jgi:hypothetical protein
MHTHTTHTALPWTYRQCTLDTPHSVRFWIDGPNMEPIADVKENAEPEANAAFIVTACNAHHDLLEACKLAANAIESRDNGLLQHALYQATAAIAKAQGGE